jgi:hypothetical protein
MLAILSKTNIKKIKFIMPSLFGKNRRSFAKSDKIINIAQLILLP